VSRSGGNAIRYLRPIGALHHPEQRPSGRATQLDWRTPRPPPRQTLIPRKKSLHPRPKHFRRGRRRDFAARRFGFDQQHPDRQLGLFGRREGGEPGVLDLDRVFEA